MTISLHYEQLINALPMAFLCGSCYHKIIAKIKLCLREQQFVILHDCGQLLKKIVLQNTIINKELKNKNW